MPVLNIETNFLTIAIVFVKKTMNQMNMHVPPNPAVGAAPNVGMHMPTGAIMQQQSPQQMQPGQPMPQPPQQDKMDNISKVKTLMGSLRETLPVST